MELIVDETHRGPSEDDVELRDCALDIPTFHRFTSGESSSWRRTLTTRCSVLAA